MIRTSTQSGVAGELTYRREQGAQVTEDIQTRHIDLMWYVSNASQKTQKYSESPD